MFGVMAMVELVLRESREERLEQRALLRADEDGMICRYIPLAGVRRPRMLSWAEERALREDLAQTLASYGPDGVALYSVAHKPGQLERVVEGLGLHARKHR